MSKNNRKITETFFVKNKSSLSLDPATSTSDDPCFSSTTADNITHQTQTQPSKEIPHRPSKSFVFPKIKSEIEIASVSTSGLNDFRGCIMIQFKYFLQFFRKGSLTFS